MAESKLVLRERLRGLRRRLSPDAVAGLSRLVGDRASAISWYQGARSVGLYVAVDNEVDPSALLADAWRCDKRVFLPVTDRQKRSMNFVWYRAGMPLRKGAFGIPEPVSDTDTPPLGSPGELDLLFLPLVGFDRQGVRLGYGGGFFDRFLETPPRPPLVGLAYGFQEVAAIPPDALDVRLDVVVTERETLYLAPSSRVLNRPL
ncbi:MAG: 5-formyltetrahydrofolate cyclo-ligase [Magnetococcales bacterium]|nr:5-formyltetrahydrofolate cyclo-ligase [Magnetococcales bacterium]